MKRVFLGKKPDEVRFAIVSIIFAFLQGIIAYLIPIAAEHICFFISAPLAIILPSYFLWKVTFKSKKNYNLGNVFIVSFFLTLFSHYLNFVFLGLGRLICYNLTGNCTDFIGEVESLFETVTYLSFFRTAISLYYWGLITLIVNILIGLYILRTSKVNYI